MRSEKEMYDLILGYANADEKYPRRHLKRFPCEPEP